MNKPFLILFTICSIGLMVFAIYKSVYADDSSNSLNNNVFQDHIQSAIPISDTLASTFFMDYHKSETSGGSEGLLKNQNVPITQFYLDDDKVIRPLREKAAALGKEFIGISAVLGYNNDDDTHTIMWVAVVNSDSGQVVIPELMLPQSHEKWDSYIYDFTTTCPTVCPTNSDRLWNRNWAE